MIAYNRLACLKPQLTDSKDRIIIAWMGPDKIQRTYTISQRIFDRFATSTAIKDTLDKWTTNNLGYVMDDVWFHLNRNGRWAMATGKEPPVIWPEDETLLKDKVST